MPDGEDVQRQEQARTEGQEQGNGQGEGEQGQQQQGFEGEFDPSRARQTITNLRTSERTLKSERQKDQQAIADLQKQLKEHEDAKLSEQERIIRDRDEHKSKATVFETKVKELSLTNEVLAESVSMNLVDPRAAAKLLDAKAIHYDADGSPTNVKEELEKLVTASPWLVRSTGGAQQAEPKNTGGRAANPGRQDASKPTFTDKQIEDFGFYQANKAAIMQAMKEGRITKG